VLGRRREEQGYLILVPGVGVLVLRWLGHDLRHADASGRATGYEALLDRLGERCFEDVAADLDAAARELVDPAGDVVTVEAAERDCAKSALDVRDRPLVALAGRDGDVGAGRDVAPD
jgi:hypothetical protein